MVPGKTDPAAPELTVSRLIDAPRALVFKAWTQPEHAARWWGPRGFTVESCRLDARPGGTYRVAMRSPEGTLRTKRGVYQEVASPERLTFTYAWEDAAGEPGHTMHVVVTFEARGEQTLLTLRQTGFESVAECDSHREGWTSCFERFAEFAAMMAAGEAADRR
ncbi:MAG TPA: SRPBCC domain-containing protein [Acetobacteraceae bacterium]|nr:SRPBCC domain-containing protein [Acetobacteraceae bacterium]